MVNLGISLVYPYRALFFSTTLTTILLKAFILKAFASHNLPSDNRCQYLYFSLL